MKCLVVDEKTDGTKICCEKTTFSREACLELEEKGRQRNDECIANNSCSLWDIWCRPSIMLHPKVALTHCEHLYNLAPNWDLLPIESEVLLLFSLCWILMKPSMPGSRSFVLTELVTKSAAVHHSVGHWAVVMWEDSMWTVSKELKARRRNNRWPYLLSKPCLHKVSQ